MFFELNVGGYWRQVSKHFSDSSFHPESMKESLSLSTRLVEQRPKAIKQIELEGWYCWLSKLGTTAGCADFGT